MEVTQTEAAAEPWEQQAGEPDHHYAMFRAYLALGGKRTYRALVDALRRKNLPASNAGHFKYIGVEWRWRERAAAWDAATAPPPRPATSEAWAQQPGEPDPLYLVFQQYLALGPKRSVRAAVEARRAVDPATPSQYMGKVACSTWHWRERAAAWETAHAGVQTQPAASAGENLQPWEQQPWLQQPGEKDRWHQIFRRYLELGPARNIHRAATLCLQQDPTLPMPVYVYELARRYHWQERAEAWDLRNVDGNADGATAAEAAAVVAAPVHVWDRQPDEPARAYGFFCRFLELGPGRSISRAVRELGEGESGGSAANFYSLARRWKWRERAAEWDIYQHEQFRAHIQERRLAMLEHRLDVAEVYFDQAVDAMETANLGGLDETQARRMLPTIHTIIKDMGTIQRTELEYAEKQRQSAASEPTGEEMARLWARLQQYRTEKQQREEDQREEDQQRAAGQNTQAAADSPAAIPVPRTLLVCVGPHPELALDLAALRAARGLDLHRLAVLTRANLESVLRRERSHGRPIELVHMAVHAGSTGVEFADGLVDGAWLSGQLMGVQVLMLSGCQTDNVGDWLRAVPYVVTLADDITHGDAALLAEQFWKGIGAGQDPTQALTVALNKTSPIVREFVTRHW